MLPFIIADSCSNLFLNVLMLSFPIMTRFILFILISSRKDSGSFCSVQFEFVKDELDDAYYMFRAVFNGISLFWITALSLWEKHQTYSLINFPKFLLGRPWSFLLRCNLSGKWSNSLLMILCNIKAKFFAVHFSCNSLLALFLSRIVDLHEVSRMI